MENEENQRNSKNFFIIFFSKNIQYKYRVNFLSQTSLLSHISPHKCPAKKTFTIVNSTSNALSDTLIAVKVTAGVPDVIDFIKL